MYVGFLVVSWWFHSTVALRVDGVCSVINAFFFTFLFSNRDLFSVRVTHLGHYSTRPAQQRGSAPLLTRT